MTLLAVGSSAAAQNFGASPRTNIGQKRQSMKSLDADHEPSNGVQIQMFYEPRKKNHGLPHDPYTAIVAPRPIGWITSMSLNGEINLAPYSFFNTVSRDPPMVMFASNSRKDTLNFVEETKEFVCNLAVWELRNQVKETSWTYPTGVNEMEAAGLEAAPSVLVKPPRVSLTLCTRMQVAADRAP
jgi:hypothetical protein